MIRLYIYIITISYHSLPDTKKDKKSKDYIRLKASDIGMCEEISESTYLGDVETEDSKIWRDKERACTSEWLNPSQSVQTHYCSN